MSKRVVITGLGCVTSLGTKVDQVWDGMITGKSGIKKIEKFDISAYSTKIAGEITVWNGGEHIDRRAAKRLDRFAQYALHASIEAVADSGIDYDKEDPYRGGVIIGSGIGGMQEFEEGHRKLMEKGPERLSPFMVPKLMCNAAAGNVSIHFGVRGPNCALVSACASGAHAIGEGFEMIRRGACDSVIAGGAEAAVTPLGLGCFIALKALSKHNDDPTRASRPFDKDRDGFVLSEGAGIIILEEYEHAVARGAHIYCEMVGYGQSADGIHITAPDEEGRGAAFAMEYACKDAGVSPSDIDYINAHGTSTGLGDIAETRAVKRLFKDDAYKLCMSSTKSVTGHLLGASGGLEAVATSLAVEKGIMPPTMNLENPEEECDLDFVANEAREKDIKVALSNSFGFGGHNTSLAFRKI